MAWHAWLVVGLALVLAAPLYAAAPLLSLAVVVVVAGYLGVAALRAWRDARDPVWRLPRCRDCGAAVTEGMAVCPTCGGVAIDRPVRAPRPGPAERATTRRAAEEPRRPPVGPAPPPGVGQPQPKYE